jgi:hypothetical protein
MTTNEHKYGLQDDVDDDDVGDTAMTDVMIAVDNDAAPLVMGTMMGTPEAIAVMVMMTILLTTAPANVTISWTIKQMIMTTKQTTEMTAKTLCHHR